MTETVMAYFFASWCAPTLLQLNGGTSLVVTSTISYFDLRQWKARANSMIFAWPRNKEGHVLRRRDTDWSEHNPRSYENVTQRTDDQESCLYLEKNLSEQEKK